MFCILLIFYKNNVKILFNKEDLFFRIERYILDWFIIGK